MKRKSILTVFSVLVIISVALRTIQLFFFSEVVNGTSSGFGAVEYKVYNNIIYIIFVVFSLVVFCLPCFSKNSFKYNIKHIERNYFISFFSVVSAIVAIILPITRYLKSGLFSNKYIIIYLISLLFGLLGAMFFIINAVKVSKGDKCSNALTIMPVLFICVELVLYFINLTGVTLIAENVIFILFLCSALIFFLYHGKLLSRVENRKSFRKIIPIGYLTCYLGIMYSIPSLIVYFIDKSKLHISEFLFDYLYIIIGIYALVFVLSLSKEKVNYIEDSLEK